VEAAERDAFLGRTPGLCAVLSTNGANGVPYAVPVWYRWDGGRAFVWSDEGRRWVRNLLRDPRLALTIAEHEEPFSAVLIRGRAEIRSGRSSAILDEVKEIIARYVPAGEVEAVFESYDQGQDHAIVTIEPASIVAWKTPP
jgi:PPOX class probable F420-dependent enzyme